MFSPATPVFCHTQHYKTKQAKQSCVPSLLKRPLAAPFFLQSCNIQKYFSKFSLALILWVYYTQICLVSLWTFNSLRCHSQAQFICFKLTSCQHCGVLPCSRSRIQHVTLLYFPYVLSSFIKAPFESSSAELFLEAAKDLPPWLWEASTPRLYFLLQIKIESGTAKRMEWAYSVPVGSFASLSAELLSPCPARRIWIPFPKGKSWDSEVKWPDCTEEVQGL